MAEAKETEAFVSEKYETAKDSFDSIVFRLDPEPTLAAIRRFLMRETVYNPETKSFSRPEGVEPIFNEFGVEELLLELRARMSVDKVLSKLENNNIRRITREVGEVVLGFLVLNCDRYKIDYNDLDRILWLIIHNVEIFLMRAVGGFENELLAQSFITRELVSKRKGGEYTESPAAPSSSMFSIFKK